MELKNVAEQALVSLIQSATEAMTFLKGEVPLAVKELLTYYTTYYALITIIWLSLVVWHLFFMAWYFKKEYTRDSEDVRAIMGSLIVAIIAIIGSIEGLFPLLKIVLAPRIWLLEYASQIVK